MQDIDQLAQRLGTVQHFRGLTPAQLRSIVASGTVRHVAAGEIIFHESEPGANLCVLICGKVQISRLGIDGKEAVIAIFEPVIMFNEVAALDGGPNSATAAALHDCILWQLDGVHLKEMLLGYPQIAWGMLQVLAGRNRHLVAQFHNVALRPVVSRCAKIIYELSAGGTRTIDRRAHPNRTMAARVVTAPELFSRSLGALVRAGILRVSPHKIEVLNPACLAETAQLDPVLLEGGEYRAV